MNTAAAAQSPPALPTPPEKLMRLSRLGAFFPTRLSFMRVLLRHLSEQRAAVRRPRWEIDPNGYGSAVYTVRVAGEEYSLVAFSNALDDSQRSDRVIANAWDTTYVLYDGVPTAAEVARLAANAPRQEAGRYDARALVLCRANKSLRFFNHTVERLAAGRQPDDALVTSVGYLMRTTAVYGNGKFGIADRAAFSARPLMQPPFQAELLAVWLVRLFTFDLVEHIARCMAPRRAVPLAPHIKRYLGIGNATGLGMAPFLVNHPLLLHQWMQTRERALQHALDAEAPAEENNEGNARLRALLHRARRHVAQWHTGDEKQRRRIDILQDELATLAATATPEWLAQPQPRRRLLALAQRHSPDCQELITALLLEAEPAVNALAPQLSSDIRATLQPAMRVGELRELIGKNFAWALAIDYGTEKHSRRFWYVSAEKLEPRLGDRHRQEGSDKEMPLDIARRIKALARALAAAEVDGAQGVGEFLLDKPALRFAAQRVQTQSLHRYAEIYDNLIDETCLPIDMLRFKLSFFGACKFDPKSDLWTRIALFQGAPLADELQTEAMDDWWLPTYDGAEGAEGDEGEERAPLHQ